MLFTTQMLAGAPTGENDTLRNELGQPFFPDFPNEPGVDCVENQVIAQFLNNALTLPLGKEEAKLQSCNLGLNLLFLLQQYDVYYVEKVFRGFWPEDTLMTIGDSITVGVNDLSQIFLLKLQDTGKDIFQLISDLQDYENCYFAEPNGYVFSTIEPNDSRFGSQWNLQNFDGSSSFGISCPVAWNHTVGSPDVRIGIFDTGINYYHEDFGGEGLGSQKIPLGANFVEGNNDPWCDNAYHGTACAGIAAALTNNNEMGIAGIAGGWAQDGNDIGAAIIPMQVSRNSDGRGEMSTLANAIRAGADPSGTYDCDVISMSLGAYGYFETVRGALCYANIAWGTAVASKGNRGVDNWHYPSDVDGSWVISVGAYNSRGQRYSWSNYGNNIDFLAPAIVYATYPYPPLYRLFGGTSSAAPHASGSAGLVRSLIPGLHPDDIDRILSYSNPTTGDGNPVYDDYRGNGLLNVGRAISRLTGNHPHISPWKLYFHRTPAGYTEVANVVEGIGAFNHKDPYDIPTGQYICHQYDLRVGVLYEEQFIEVPKAWGRGMNVTKGWSGAIPNNMAEYCGVVYGSERIDGCTLQTFVYELWRIISWFPFEIEYSGWWPCQPQEVECEYTIWGRAKLSTPRDGPGGPGKPGVDTPVAFSVGEFYPNPFNSSATVSLSLNSPATVVIQIYDVLGRRAEYLDLGELHSGDHTMTWEANDSAGQKLPSGIYFAVFKTANTSLIRKIMILR